jgi:nucleoside-diphosphate-sugar epimerase
MSKKETRCDIAILGLGWVGQATALELKEKGYSLWGTVSSYQKAKKLQSEHLFAYVLRLPDSMASFPGPKPEYMLYTLPPREGQERSKEMIQDAIRMAEETAVKGAIYLSSTSVYGAAEGWVDESDAKEVKSPHSGVIMKRLEDQWSEASFPTTILRLGGLYGPGRSPGRFMRGKTISKPNQYVNMTSQTDAVTAIYRIVKKGLWGKTLNIVSHNAQRRREFYGQRLQQPKFGEPTASDGKQVSTQRARALLGTDFLAEPPSSGKEN